MLGEPNFQASARLQDGKVRITVSAVVPYGDRSVTVTEEVKSKALKDEFKALLDRAVEENGEAIGNRAEVEAARARVVASDLGEKA